MLRSRMQVGFGVSVAFLLFCSTALADQYHYVNTLIGERASGMGGAYTAVSDDATGLYYNPAGIMYSTGRSLSASVNAYYTQTKKYENVIGGMGWEREAETLLPNYFGVIQPLGSVKIGMSYAVPDAVTEDQDQVFTNVPSRFPGITATEYSINFNNEDTTYLFGPSAAMEIAKDLAVGITLYYQVRSNQLVLNQLIQLDNGKYESSNFYSELHESAVKPILGAIWSPVEKVSVGLTVSKALVIHESVSNQLTYKDSNYDADTIDRQYGYTNAKKKYPTQIKAGVAYFPSRSLLASLDLSYNTKVTDPEFKDRVSVVNAAIGAEYFLSRSWAVRGGFFTDLANTPDIEAGKTGQLENVDLYGLSASISHFTRNTSLTFGGSVTQGDGKAQVLAASTEVQNLKVAGWMLFLSSSYSY